MTGERGNATAEPSTLDEEQGGPSSSSPEAEVVSALAVVGCPDEPWRLGEVALMPSAATSGPRLLGRGSPQPDDPCPRLVFAPFAPDTMDSALPIGVKRISRIQAFFTPAERGAIFVRNVGRCDLLHNGDPVDTATVRPGDVIQFGRQLLLLCVLREPNLRLPEDAYAVERFGEPDAFGIAGESDAAWRLRRRVRFVAERSGHVLIHGASGTGKELVAGAIHALSERRARPMVSRNAATVPDGIIDAELFGNVRNYPTHGMSERPGLIGQADRSSLFLDEFAELPLSMQTHLLRVLDAGDYQRLGDAAARRADLRLIAATNRPIATIQEDLRARFAFVVETPDLNDRRDDIPLIARHLLRRLGSGDAKIADRVFPEGKLEREPKLSLDLLRVLVTHPYRTNVRELERLLWRAIEASRAGELDLPRESNTTCSDDARYTTPHRRPASDGHILDTQSGLPPASRVQAVLDEHNGSMEAAWRALGLSNRYVLRRLIAKYGVDVRRKPTVKR
jgi:two-component system nitrogen regulation response regulator GlnG/two-component system response regulator HydG